MIFCLGVFNKPMTLGGLVHLNKTRKFPSDSIVRFPFFANFDVPSQLFCHLQILNLYYQDVNSDCFTGPLTSLTLPIVLTRNWK